MTLRLRPFSRDDAQVLSALFRAAVLTTGARAYSPRQTEIWARHGAPADDLARRLDRGVTLVATLDDRIAGFAQLHPHDHIEYLYTHPDFTRRGVARALILALHDHARRLGARAVSTEASIVARPVFESLGYTVVQTQHVQREDVTFERYLMSVTLGG